MADDTFGARHLMAHNSGKSGKDSLFFNKVAGAVLASVLAVLVVRQVGDALYHPQHLETAAYAIAVPDSANHSEDAVETVDFSALLASADIAKGERLARKCSQCHTFDKGGANGTGPNLWDIVGRNRASIADFNYSAPIQAMGGTWTVAELSNFLENPKGTIKGTNMAFAGLRKPEDRADIITYLASLSDNPQPLIEAVVEDAEDMDMDVEDSPADVEELHESDAAPAAETESGDH